MRASVEPSAAQADAAVDDAAEQVLGDGEVIILKLRPSGWFTLLVSWPAVAVAIFAALLAIVAVRVFRVDIPVRLAYLVPACMVIALLRVYLACLQWMKRVYILTNRRVIRFRGLFRTEIFDCPLTGIQSASLSQSSGERFFRVASLFFEIPGMEPDAGVWLHLPRPHDVEEIVQQALRQSRR